MDRRRVEYRTGNKQGFGRPEPSLPPACSPRTLVSFLIALGIALAVSLSCCTLQPAHAAPATISGTCYVECTNPQFDGALGGDTFLVRFSQYGIEATGYCTSGPLYGTPLPGHYPFTGTRMDNGSYLIAIDCSGADMYPNHYSPLGAQNVGNFSIFVFGTVELWKHGNPSYESAVPGTTIEQARYHLLASDGSVQTTLTTNADGWAQASDVPLGTYNLLEVEASPGYTLDKDVHQVVVIGGETAQVHSWEQPLLGAVGVTKTSASPTITDNNPCYELAGAVYGVYSDNACTNQVQSIVTDADGSGQCPAELWPGTYWVKEVTPPPGYALNDQVYPVTLGIENCRRATVARARTIDEPQLVPVDVIVAKVDAETGLDQPQGDATLAGAVFSVEHYAASFTTPQEAAASGLAPTLTCTVTTNDQGRAHINTTVLPSNSAGAGLPLGTLVVQEIQPPQGYLLPDQPAFAIPLTGSGHTPLAPLAHPVNIAEQAIRGDIAVVKVGNEEGSVGNQPTKQPLSGVAFDVLHEASGHTVARIVTDEQGFASTAHLREGEQAGTLPFGTYLVREDPATTPAGYEPTPAFPVTVAEHARTYVFTVENNTGTFIRVVKQDAGTGRSIAGYTTFRILDATGAVVSFGSATPGQTAQTEFTTDQNGSCTLPEKLNGGKTYFVQEVTPPHGYVLDATPVPFSLAEGDGHHPEHPLVVVLENTPQTGAITVRKTDAITELPLARSGITWDVRAVEDVITPDGTTRARAGETVACITSDENGHATVEGLHLGAYEIVETQAPYGYARATEPLRVEVVYGNPTQTFVDTEATMPNKPAMGRMVITKIDETTQEPLAQAHFALRAAEDIFASDGSVLLRAGDTVDELCTDATGMATSALVPLGHYQVVEIQAPDGYILDTSSHPVEFTYQNQDTPIVEATLMLANTPAPTIAKTGDHPLSTALLLTALTTLAALGVLTTAARSIQKRAAQIGRHATS